MLDKVIFKLINSKEREKFLWALESKFGTDAYVDFLREFSLNPKSSTKLMKEFKNRKFFDDCEIRVSKKDSFEAARDMQRNILDKEEKVHFCFH